MPHTFRILFARPVSWCHCQCHISRFHSRTTFSSQSSFSFLSKESWHRIFVQLSPPIPSLGSQVSGKLILKTARDDVQRTNHDVAGGHREVFTASFYENFPKLFEHSVTFFERCMYLFLPYVQNLSNSRTQHKISPPCVQGSMHSSLVLLYSDTLVTSNDRGTKRVIFGGGGRWIIFRSFAFGTFQMAITSDTRIGTPEQLCR